MENQPLPRQIVITSDGSHTLYIPGLGEHYHSVHGAIQESEHVFIQAGLAFLNERTPIRILEIGFGTGLNTLLTLKYASENNRTIEYTTLEKYPLQPNEYSLLNYGKLLGSDWENPFITLHTCGWEHENVITSLFKLTKMNVDMVAIDLENAFDLIYFDAFGPEIQPDLWSETVFQNMYRALCFGGILVTYSAKGQVRRNLLAAGFNVERIPGPPGKREMLRATKSRNQ
jgi:tRNA U34 5-methylaminomethyl-2-thiouridine-forming methyltransferase MnmC